MMNRNRYNVLKRAIPLSMFFFSLNYSTFANLCNYNVSNMIIMRYSLLIKNQQLMVTLSPLF